MHPQTLRKYERLGLVQPARTIGSMRLYSADGDRPAPPDQGPGRGRRRQPGRRAAPARCRRGAATARAAARGPGAGPRRGPPPCRPRSAADQGRRRDLAMEFRDYYKTLGVSKTATAKEIKQAFRRLARKHHPDVNPGDRAAETTFKELNEAYEVLGNPESRKKYDELGANWRQYEQAGPGGSPGWGGAGGGATYPHDDARGDGADVRRREQPVLRLLQRVLRRADHRAAAHPGRRARAGPAGGATRVPTSRSTWRRRWAARSNGSPYRETAAPSRCGFRPASPDGSRLTAGDLQLRVRLKPHPAVRAPGTRSHHAGRRAGVDAGQGTR